MRQLLYASSTSRDIADSELQNILATARRNNEPKNVTGLLLHIDGGFMQVLEGEDQTLDDLYAHIARDKRHWEARVIFNRQPPRAFGNWSMGFKTLKSNIPSEAAAFEITKSAIKHRIKATDAPEVMVMLSTFYRVQSGEAALRLIPSVFGEKLITGMMTRGYDEEFAGAVGDAHGARSRQ